MLGLRWLMDVLEPNTTTSDRRLLIVDGHSSHVSPKFIAFCITHSIDLMILPAHSSHITQPLDVAVFGPLKTALGRETDALQDRDRMQKADWARLMVRARETSMTASNIRSGFKSTGL